MWKVIALIVLFLYGGFLPREWLFAHTADAKTLINIVKTGDIDGLSQLISDHKIDNATMVESVPFANALLHAGQLDLLNYAMFKGVYLVLDDYLEYKSINGFFNFVKKQKSFEKVISFFKSTQEKQIKKESDAFLSSILDSWVNVGNFLQESMRAYSKIIKQYKDTKLYYKNISKQYDEAQLEHNFRVEKTAVINAINDKARMLKTGLSPYVAFTQYKGKTFFEYIYLIMDILFAYPNQLLSSEFFLLFNEIQGVNGNTLLHDAILQQKNAVIKKICSIATWNFQVPNNDGKNPLMFAIDKVDYDAVILFKYKHNLLSFDELFRLIHFIGSAFNALLLHERDMKAEYRYYNHLFMFNRDIDQLFHAALLAGRNALVKALVYYGVSDPQVLDWQSEDVEIFSFLLQQKEAWGDLSLMINGEFDNRAFDVRLGQIMKILSPYELYKGNTALHFIAGAAKSSNLLKHFITSHHFMAIDRLNQKKEIPFLTALYNQQYLNAGMLFMVKGGFNRSYDVELHADVVELINVAANIKPPASYVLNLKRLLAKAITAKTRVCT